ncbi:putative uncharacterized protein DDB_G0277255 [Aplysia californica]|uniref:Uncharacterized protein n=1 Tax=Aplysia californica TaxID=6500 RepID=A0ABM1VZT0_APLCA|nr:putative uncharacterized protein DDB_G0277255 [Aplysia californica]
MAEYGLYGAMVRHSLPLPETIIKSAKEGVLESSAPWLLSMYRKSIESTGSKSGDSDSSAPDDEGGTPNGSMPVTSDDKKVDDFRSESIAALRARAQEYSAKNFTRSSSSGDTADTKNLDSDVMEEESDEDSRDSCMSPDERLVTGVKSSCEPFPMDSSSLAEGQDERSARGGFPEKRHPRAATTSSVHGSASNSNNNNNTNTNTNTNSSNNKNNISFSLSSLPLSSKEKNRSEIDPAPGVSKSPLYVNTDRMNINQCVNSNSSKAGFDHKIMSDQQTLTSRNSQTSKSLMIPFANAYSFSPSGNALNESLTNSARQAAMTRGILPPAMNYFNGQFGMGNAHPMNIPNSPSSKGLSLPLGFPSTGWPHPFSALFPAVAPEPLKSHPFMEAYGMHALGKASLGVHAYLTPAHQSGRLGAVREAELVEKPSGLTPPSSVMAL